jgi:tetratricopeptide (TPR) repeat protein
VANPRIDDLRKRLEKEPGSRLFAQLAEELRKEGELGEAIGVARDGLLRHPAYPSARMTLGRALLDNGELGPARVEFEAVLKGAPDNILASRFLGECLEGLGDLAGAQARYKATLLLSPGDRQVQGRLEELEAKLRRRLAGGGGAHVPHALEDDRPIPVAQVDEPMVLESAHQGRGVESGPAASFERAEDEPPPIPVADLEESFELERPYEAPVPTPWKTESFTPTREAVFEEDAATIPPGSAFREPTDVGSAPALPEPVAAEPPEEVFVEPEPLHEEPETVAAEDLVESAAEPPGQASLSSSTLAELYFNQGFSAKAIDVYRQLLDREPGNERARARLTELEAFERHLEAEEGALPVEAGTAGRGAAADPQALRRQAIEQTIARLEGLLAALRKG